MNNCELIVCLYETIEIMIRKFAYTRVHGVDLRLEVRIRAPDQVVVAILAKTHWLQQQGNVVHVSSLQCK